jgi:predicted transcriptional regulator
MANPSIYLDDEEWRYVQQEAERRDESISWIVRDAIRREIND